MAVRSIRNSILWGRPSIFPSLPPVFVNSIPKSGTHLLTQIAEGLASNDDWGTFLASTPSRTMREIPAVRLRRKLQQLAPGETARGHLFWHPLLANQFDVGGIVSYFIYRDPRDVALSEAQYLRSMNRFHRMHRVFKDLSPDEALLLSINGWPDAASQDVYFPNIGIRYRRYLGWRSHAATLAIRFEDLRGEDSHMWIRRIVGHYVAASGHNESDADGMVSSATNAINPSKSHTYRQGRVGGWRDTYRREHLDAFHAVSGSLLAELGYE